MKIICDNQYFLYGLKALCPDLERRLSPGVCSETVFIISSVSPPEIFRFLSANLYRYRSIVFYASPDAMRFLYGVVDGTVYDILTLIPPLLYHERKIPEKAYISTTMIHLTDRQHMVKVILLNGISLSRGALLLGISLNTLSAHKQNLMQRLKVRNDMELLYKVIILSEKFMSDN
ncbi:LuxR C-terminal-related transcriptional regulator [Escherichia coli]|uniref:LuxR C-terminal-related transcriptional regulator n=1 Tax=Escherichia coli TaxID=562 RepID=UPI00111BEBC9|nr:LuxR C-terminal-related transcriptional regulator [Escherichia coli]